MYVLSSLELPRSNTARAIPCDRGRVCDWGSNESQFDRLRLHVHFPPAAPWLDQALNAWRVLQSWRPLHPGPPLRLPQIACNVKKTPRGPDKLKEDMGRVPGIAKKIFGPVPDDQAKDKPDPSSKTE